MFLKKIKQKKIAEAIKNDREYLDDCLYKLKTSFEEKGLEFPESHYEFSSDTPGLTIGSRFIPFEEKNLNYTVFGFPCELKYPSFPFPRYKGQCLDSLENLLKQSHPFFEQEIVTIEGIPFNKVLLKRHLKGAIVKLSPISKAVSSFIKEKDKEEYFQSNLDFIYVGENPKSVNEENLAKAFENLEAKARIHIPQIKLFFEKEVGNTIRIYDQNGKVILERLMAKNGISSSGNKELRFTDAITKEVVTFNQDHFMYYTMGHEGITNA